MYTVIQDTWNEDDDQDLLEYVSKNKIPTKIMSKREILEEPLSNIDALFCDTIIIQKKLTKYVPPPTYSDCFNHLYNRKIQIATVEECIKMNLPIFVKPVAQDKQFDGFIIENKNDIIYLQENTTNNQKVYCSSVVSFVNEFRLFIRNNKVDGIVDASDYILGTGLQKNEEPPKSFIQKVLKANPYNNAVIDVGLLNTANMRKWAIIETNPPFSLSSYDWLIEKYYKYCRLIWLQLRDESI